MTLASLFVRIKWTTVHALLKLFTARACRVTSFQFHARIFYMNNRMFFPNVCFFAWNVFWHGMCSSKNWKSFLTFHFDVKSLLFFEMNRESCVLQTKRIVVKDSNFNFTLACDIRFCTSSWKINWFCMVYILFSNSLIPDTRSISIDFYNFISPFSP